MRDELARLVDLDLVSGYRSPRRLALLRYAASGRLRRLDGIYVESSTFLPSEADVAFLGLARLLDIPVLTYVRDAYQLFPEYDRDTSLRRRIGRAAFRPAVRALAAVSSTLAFPSLGLATALVGAHNSPFVLIPPGSREPVRAPWRSDARTLLFVGNGTLEAQGAARLITAVGLARASGTDIDLTVISRPGEQPPPPHPDWLDVAVGEAAEIEARLPSVVATVIPRPRGPYNDLAVPVKLYDYLAYGRPLVVTDCTEQASVVRAAGAGIVTGDGPAALADGFRRLVDAGPERRRQWGANAESAARAASWHDRARLVLAALGIPA